MKHGVNALQNSSLNWSFCSKLCAESSSEKILKEDMLKKEMAVLLQDFRKWCKISRTGNVI